MKNLNDLGVQEMDVREMKEENGGTFTFLNWIKISRSWRTDYDYYNA
ncbi:hypothetical protein SAMN06265379_103222 [Saccharicrinis carchari]|uniref:Uncharacterized protein n=1 Tax=Saccharicrinis carchari TaxID=1168039 RepID=A0A521CK72_SACCC|nr:hypothetical protein [Saccharicrinis carchari]SMO59859.1 hypothetical protein SAMN06265379_103222 [Saccharicrinis carchari]